MDSFSFFKVFCGLARGARRLAVEHDLQDFLDK
jgi:hypothetical protein